MLQADVAGEATDVQRPPAYLGALIVLKSHECRRWVLGIVAGEASALHSGLLLTATRLLVSNPHFLTYVHRTSGCGMPAIFQTCPVVGGWLSFGMPLA